MRALALLIVLSAFILVPASAAAHGARVESSVTRTVKVQVELEVEVRATYHSGRPMAGAQVTVIAPDGTGEPWTVGTCDDEGVFVFEADPSLPGTWEARVVLHGHGGVLSFEVEEAVDGTGNGEASSSTTRVEASSEPHLSTLQRVTMGCCVVWGLVGTALFFMRRRV